MNKAILLRDFFMAGNRRELEAACEPLLRSGMLAPLSDEGWQRLEFGFNRLFIGPRSVIAPPYASVYLDEEGYLMGDTTQQVRNLYRMIGLNSPWMGRLPEDHISLELDASLQMRTAIEKTGSSLLVPVYGYFLRDHMGCWIPAFSERIEEAPDLPDPLRLISSLLLQWLCEETEWLAQAPIHDSESFFQNEERRL